MSERKKKKLALKKSSSAKLSGTKTGDQQGPNTILSLFRKQREKQVIDIENEDASSTIDTQAETEGSEGDVVITKVESTGPHSLIQTGIKSNKWDSLKSSDSKKKLSLSKTRKRKAAGIDTSDEHDDDEFKPSKSKYFNKDKPTTSTVNKLESPGRYNLRKSKTDPVIDLSESDDDLSGIKKDDVWKDSCKDSSQKENLLVPVQTASGLNTEKRENKLKSKLSLKKYKTDSDVQRTTRKFNKEQNVIQIEIDDTDSNDTDISKRTASKSDTDPNTGSETAASSNEGTNKKGQHSSQKESRVKDTNLQKKTVDNVCEDSINLIEVHVSPTKSDCVQTQKDDSISHDSQPLKGKTYTPTATYSIFNPQKGIKQTPKVPSETKLSKKASLTVEKKPLVKAGKNASQKIAKEESFGKSQNKTSTIKKPIAAKKSAVDEVDEDNDDDYDSDSKSDIIGDGKNTTAEGEPVYRVPYYLENFRTILDTVLSDTENTRLFNETDMKYITAFNSLEEAPQKLYVRLFSRKLAWLPMAKINYPEISDDIEGLINTLVDASLLIAGDDLTDISQLLHVLAAPDLKTLAKSFHLNITGATKKQIIQMLIKKSQQNSISTMFKGGASMSTEKSMVSRAKSYLGQTCRLHAESRAVFIRVLSLFSPYHTNLDEESAQGGQNQLFQMLMANIGRVVYPSYTVNRQRAVFKDRDALMRFETALMYELEIETKTVKNKWTEAYEIYQQARTIGKDICGNKEFLEWDLELPLFLRSYTAGSVYTRIDNQGVEILQRLKKYKEAVKLLEELLSQAAYCPEYRGHWYDRLALNLDAHLKSQEKCLEVVKAGLSDPEVRPSRRYLLYQRAEKICTGPNSKFLKRLAEIEPVKVTDAPEHYVEGMVMPDAGSMGMKYQFVLEGGDEGVTLCAVEELALEHYKENGYPEGLHAEGSIISNLFLMFFWDIEFMDIPNVFHSPFQTAPLDMMTTEFYTSRQRQVDERLEWLRIADIEILLAEVGTIWEKHNGTMCAGINWEKFSGPQKLQGLVSCMGGKVIAGILERYVKDPRHTRSGFPDLTLWNTETKTFKISEVKGPGDRLSHKQILWLHYLLELGVDAEVCYVRAVGSKKLKPVAKKS